MGSHGIKDRVAIVGMGCTPFGEHWDKSTDDLLIDSTNEAFGSVGLTKDDIDAYWLGTMGSGQGSGLTLSKPLKLDYKPVTRVENYCATGSEAFRNACYAVASGASDGSASAIIVRAEDAEKYTDKPLYVKALSFAAGPGSGPIDPDYDYTTFEEVVRSSQDAYQQAGVTDPRSQIAMAEVHDCFTPTELVLMEDLGFSERGHAWKDVLDGAFDLDGDLPVNPDGGLTSFGHPIGASGLRMLFECWLQLRGEAPEERKIATVDQGRTLGLTHNLGGAPGQCVSFVSIVGAQPD